MPIIAAIILKSRLCGDLTKRRKNMNRSDTLMLLQECSSGIKTAIASIDDVLPFVKESEFKQVLKESKTEHKSLEQKINGELEKINAPAKEPGIMAKSMSKVKINAELAFKPTSAQAASLITDGCSMGIKTITRCLNQYPAADSGAKKLAEKITLLEENLEDKMKPYL